MAAATRIGAEYARDSVTCNAGIQVLPPPPTISSACVTGISNAITISTLVNTATVTIPTPTLVCQCELTGVPATYHVCAGTNNFDSCFANPPTGFTGPSRYFITVSASQPFTPLFTWSGGPGLPGLALLPQYGERGNGASLEMIRNRSSRRDGERGAVLIEAAVAMLTVVFLILGGIQVGAALWAWHTMLLAVGEAGRYAMVYSSYSPNGPPTCADTLANCAVTNANQIWGDTFGTVACTGTCTGTPTTLTFTASYNVNVLVTSITLRRQMTVPVI